ncbi:hypothetical protein JAAARDRAFT_30323 [Jaapia argillacea MUCL 33604]|uniref:HIT-type domain-containing protein n=1 Tax=Jaapia argillacea MUCL 33604 TaxID=933084 RepID=A0A067Q5W2_9AGAM|nr:hypothetical protein JAAARDRAFT_30323 [Jaapia argillacea MUCL 33604]
MFDSPPPVNSSLVRCLSDLFTELRVRDVADTPNLKLSSSSLPCDVPSQSLPKIRDMVRRLTTFYVNNEISSYDLPFSYFLRANERDGKLAEMAIVSNCNAWTLGEVIARSLLSSLSKGSSTGSDCYPKAEIESYLRVILAIVAEPSIAQTLHTRNDAGDCGSRRSKSKPRVRCFDLWPKASNLPSGSQSCLASPIAESGSSPIDTRRRRRTMSLLSVSSASSKISLEATKATPIAELSVCDDASTCGSFTPTRSAFDSLRLHKSSTSQWQSNSSHHPSPPSPECPSSPVGSTFSSIPSISRTTSPVSPTDSLYTADTSVHSSPQSTLKLRAPLRRVESNTMNPILSNLETASKLRTTCRCATCGVPGSNFPKCPRCAEMWCSRECRVRSCGGKKHVCSTRGT